MLDSFNITNLIEKGEWEEQVLRLVFFVLPILPIHHQ